MKKMYKCIMIACMGLLMACSPKIRTDIISNHSALSYDAQILVFTEKEVVPDGLNEIGEVSLGDSGFTTKCNYEIMIEKAKLEARKAGANIVKITEHKFPSAFGSSCHRLKVTLYHAEDLTKIAKEEVKEPFIEGADYALLYVYRYKGAGALVSYNVKLGDSTICRVKNNYKNTIKIKKEGLNTIWAKTESKIEVPIDVEFGKRYFLRCSVKMGAFVGRPDLELVDYKTGISEFESFEAKHDETKKN